MMRESRPRASITRPPPDRAAAVAVIGRPPAPAFRIHQNGVRRPGAKLEAN